jgi:tellurite resistance protein TerC
LVHLEKSVVALLFFIAGKLALNSSDHFLHHGFNISATSSLIVVLVVLTTGILASVMFPEKVEINESKTN